MPFERYTAVDGADLEAARLSQPKIKLLPYQSSVCRQIDEHLAAGARRVVVCMRTAAGKTVVGTEEVRKASQKGGRVLWLCHTEELVQQAADELSAYDPSLRDIGFIKAGRPTRLLARVQIGSVQTIDARSFRSRKIDLGHFDLIVVDECHHARARTWQQVIEAFPNASVIGLTATPCRGDGLGLGNLFDVLILGPDFEELEREGRLVRSIIFAPFRPNLKGVHVRRGDYVESELAAVMDKAKLIGDVVTHWLRHGKGRPTVVFATSVQHSVHLRDEFRINGISAEHIDGKTPRDEREAILRKLLTGEINIVSNCAVLCEGWNQPPVSCIVLARPTKSLRLFVQMVGRALRASPGTGKINAIVIDHSGAVFEHGFPEDEIAWTLETDKKAVNQTHAARLSGTRGRGLTTCPECSAVRMEGDPCGSCGWRLQAKPRYVEFTEGDLGQVSRDRSVHVLDQDEIAFSSPACCDRSGEIT
jgi:superfamily II DNA or RNA helicase